MSSMLQGSSAPTFEAVAHRAPTSLTPVAADERIHALDLLRGWAMFGVLWSNLDAWYGTRPPATSLDRALSWTQDYLITDRFYTLLIVLFGIGFGIQLMRATSRGVDVRAMYYRRSAALLAIGIVHGTLLWSGDILTIYALVAFALVMFRTVSTRRLLIASILLWFFGVIFVKEVMVFAGLRVAVPERFPEGALPFVLAHGTWLQVEQLRVRGYLLELGRFGLTNYVQILAAFLIGLWAMKTGYARRVMEDPKTTRRLLAVAIIAAAVGYVAPFILNPLLPYPPPLPPGVEPHFPYVGFQIILLHYLIAKPFTWSVEGTALAYAAILLLIWQRSWGSRLLGPLAATGRMALTTYLTQSVVCTLLFYGYGLGWFGRVGFTGMLAITLILFSCQMAISVWWLRRFRFGPAEWLWRKATYGTVPPMRLHEGAVA